MTGVAARLGYRLLEHPADVGIEAWGPTVESAYEAAAIGLTEVMVDRSKVQEREARHFSLAGRDDCDLLVRWLSELLYLFDAEGMVFGRFAVERVAAGRLEATAYGERFAPDRHEPRTAVKAVTYHQLAVEAGPPARVRLVVDV